MLASEMADIQLNKTPWNWRHLQWLWQTYVWQLCLDIEELTAHILSGKIDLKVLDIGIFDSPAIVELRDLILSRYWEKERINISLSWIDLQECKKKRWDKFYTMRFRLWWFLNIVIDFFMRKVPRFNFYESSFLLYRR